VSIIIGTVIAVACGVEAEPLTFFRGKSHSGPRQIE
jgi:hypothetical protein